MNVIEVFYYSRRKRKNAVLVSGLPGLALVGKIAADYLVKKLDVEKVATVFSPAFPPQVTVYEPGFAKLMTNDIYLYDGGQRPLYILVGDAQPPLISNAEIPAHYEFAEKMVRLFKRLGVTELYTLAGMPRPGRAHKKPGVVFVATNEEIAKKLKELGAKPARPGEAIVGAAGLFVAIGELVGIEGACLMGETFPGTVPADPEAAKAVLELLTKYLGIKVDMEEINESAEELRRTIAKMFKPPKKKEERKMPYIG